MALEMVSCTEDVLPFALMLMVECTEVGTTTLAKAAINNGMSKFVYVVYVNALGTLILLPYFIIQSQRSNRPPLTLSLLCRFFALGLLGICLLQIFAYIGIGYSSPTLGAAMGNLIPAFTFLLAIIFGMEKLELRKSSSQAKTLGATLAIAGAFVMTLYKGPTISLITSPLNSPNHRLLESQQSNWVLGGLFLAITAAFSSLWNVFQTATVKEYPDEMTIVFFFCLFGTMQSAICTLVIERKDHGAWELCPGIEMIAVVFAAVTGSVFRNGVVTWCFRKKGPVYVAIFKPISMVIAVILGIIFLGDTLHLGSLVGGLTIALGFYAVIWGQHMESNIVCGLDHNIPLLQ